MRVIIKRLISYVLLFAFSLYFSAGLVAATKSTSDILPRELVRTLVNDGLWFAELDDSNSRPSRDLAIFWEALSGSESQDRNKIIDLMFDFEGQFAAKSDGVRMKIFNANPVMVYTLRYAKENFKGKQREKVLEIETRWQERYFEIVSEIIKMAQDKELSQIVERFRTKYNSGEIRIVDLTPSLRKELADAVLLSTGSRVEEKHQGSADYKVTGIFNFSKRLFAVDFARSMDETLITIVHEMVHAADPNLDVHRKKYKGFYPEVLNILVRWSHSKDAIALIEQNVIKQVFFEKDVREFAARAMEVNTLLMNQLETKIGENKLSEKDQEVLREWIRSGIGLTIENEYRAYGFSMLVYASLKHKYNYILSESPQYERYLHKLISGDNIFVLDIALNDNPFPRARSVLFIGKTNPKVTSDLELMMDHLEYFYLKELELLLKGLNSKFSKIIGEYNDGREQESILPVWARRGNFDLPSNPYTILSARLTTSWVIRFKKHFEVILQKLQGFNEPLINLNVGILDLHDITRQDMKLTGIWYLKSKFQSIPSDCPKLPVEPELRGIRVDSDLYNEREQQYLMNLKNYFKLYKFDIDVLFREGAAPNIISGEEVVRNLIKIKLLKAHDWLEKFFPVWHSTLQSTNTFIEKLDNDIFINSKEMDSERVHALKDELLGGLKDSEASYNELSQLRLILRELGTLYDIALSERWQPVTDSFNQKVKSYLGLLDFLGTRNTDVETNTDKLQSKVDALAEQLMPLVRACEETSKPTGIFTKTPDTRIHLDRKAGPLNLPQYGNSYHLTTICYQEKLYAVRQPMDYTKFMTTQIRDGVPVSKIFFGSQKIKLVPVNLPVKERK